MMKLFIPNLFHQTIVIVVTTAIVGVITNVIKIFTTTTTVVIAIAKKSYFVTISFKLYFIIVVAVAASVEVMKKDHLIATIVGFACLVEPQNQEDQEDFEAYLIIVTAVNY